MDLINPSSHMTRVSYECHCDGDVTVFVRSFLSSGLLALMVLNEADAFRQHSLHTIGLLAMSAESWTCTTGALHQGRMSCPESTGRRGGT